MLLVSCDHIGSTRVKNLIDLTPSLEIETTAPLKLTDGKKEPFTTGKTKSYKLSKHAM